MKIAILGDSISQGIGSKMDNYEKSLKYMIGNSHEIRNFALTGTTIKYALEILPEVNAFNPDIVIMWYGNVDGMVRPKPNGRAYYKIVPNRYKENGMLNPRPYYSKRQLKKILQKIDSFIRINLNKILLKLQGEYTWVNPVEFNELYNKFLDNIVTDKANIIILSTVAIDSTLFPGTEISYVKYNQIIKKMAYEHNLIFVDAFNILKENGCWDLYYDDHFHLNKSGYDFIAKMLFEQIKNLKLRN